ncbi:BolA family transcriptional regulator [Loktanella sp. F6476L]|uniref:BolA family protein n=1 Tax=Loktanella sp. F6476L TaxID=2926405 RepID=UPI001FF373FA|nr:BolA family protein [Loktanella sp. F6476L]MCK0119460.1 BolA family transcriptional regulator [Loktanella sp. F6476L]
MGLEVEIIDAIKTKLNPASFEVINESHLHAGHAGDDGSGESHWKIVLDAPDLADKTRIARHRAVHAALGPDIINRLHALAISFR